MLLVPIAAETPRRPAIKLMKNFFILSPTFFSLSDVLCYPPFLNQNDKDIGYIKVDGVSSVFCFIWGWEEPAWGLPFQFHGVFYVMISMKGP